MRVVRERNRRPGVCYAVSDDGLELPVIDLTHPAFHFEPSAAELEALTSRSIRMLRRSQRTPAFLQRLLARRSILLRGTRAAAGGFLDGMATYLLKLGPEHLGRGYANGLDRRLAGMAGATATRLRLRDVAGLLAAGLAPQLEENPRRPLHLVDIAGGTAIGVLNALLLLSRDLPAGLAQREVRIHVLDPDNAGPHFATRALDALRASGAPLARLQATVEHQRYDWSDAGGLQDFLRSRIPEAALVAGCSEGGLFEYGTDAEIGANLDALRAATPASFFLVGSMMPDAEVTHVVHDASRMRLRLFERQAFESLLHRAGWYVERSAAGNPMYDVFRLRKS
jgi:hypothetical protein